MLAGVLRGFFRSLNDPLRRNSLFLLATHGVIGLAGFFFWRIADSCYGEEAVGKATALVSVVLLLHTLARLGLDIGLIRFLPDESDKPAMINTSLTVVGLVSAALALVFVLGVRVWSPELSVVRDNAWHAVGFVVFAATTSLVAVLRQGLFVAYRKAHSSLAIELAGALRLPIVLVFVSAGAYGIFVAWGLGGMVALAFGTALILLVQRDYRPVPSVRAAVLGRMVRFSLANYIAETLRELPGFVLPVIVLGVFATEAGSERGESMAAYFYIAWTIASVVMMISYATGASLLAEGATKPAEFGRSTVKALRFMLVLLAAAIVVVFLVGRWILAWFGPGYEEEGLMLLQVLCLSGLPMAVNTIYVTQKRMERKVWPVILVYAFVSSFTIGVGYALMHRLEPELVGIGIAWLGANCLVALVAGFLMTRSWLQARRSRRQASAEVSTS
ncbi:MAG: lipopolysaccharide biosynthesis protein [Dehalococcoidia bacterium]|nr:lipopolysaccharide biosynthesis protein [Dehalococcoidia bacterium]